VDFLSFFFFDFLSAFFLAFLSLAAFFYCLTAFFFSVFSDFLGFIISATLADYGLAVGLRLSEPIGSSMKSAGVMARENILEPSSVVNSRSSLSLSVASSRPKPLSSL
jgi:hypothetical protein